IAVEAMGLIDGALVVVQAQPVHGLEDRIDRGLRAALTVGVLDAQHELSAAMARLQPAVQRGACTADVQVAGGTGGETCAAGHGGLAWPGGAFYLAPPSALPVPCRSQVIAIQRPGGMPKALRKWRVRWLWSAKPVSTATSASGVPRTTSTRASSRRRIRWK